MDLLLDQQELLDLGENLRHTSIRCQAGCCWLTLAGDSRDHLLHAGQSHTISQRGRVVLVALSATRLQLSAAPQRHKITAAWRQLCCGR